MKTRFSFVLGAALSLSQLGFAAPLKTITGPEAEAVFNDRFSTHQELGRNSPFKVTVNSSSYFNGLFTHIALKVDPQSTCLETSHIEEPGIPTPPPSYQCQFPSYR